MTPDKSLLGKKAKTTWCFFLTDTRDLITGIGALHTAQAVLSLQ